jgi:glycosyltransferase involved in cell wall biosynthesis
MTRSRADAEPVLAAVVIARNEARHIATCLDAVLKAVAPFPDTRVIVVDSESTDETVQIAGTFPVDVYRYRARVRTAAAGRRVGARLVRARFILFVDGDSQIEPPWVRTAVDYMQRHWRVGVIYGRRHEVYEGMPAGFTSSAGPDETELGGNALYRATALRAAGGFHPFLIAEEEGELLGRLHAAGYEVAATPDLMFTHYTVPKDTWRGHLRRVCRGMTMGPGQVLRIALAQGLFRYHARRLNRLLVMLGYLFAGVMCTAAIRIGAPLWIGGVWFGAGVGAFIALWLRRGEVRSATYIVTDWVLGAIGVVVGFLFRTPGPEDFAPVVECLAQRSMAHAAPLSTGRHTGGGQRPISQVR